jgi:hypothetical protein
MPVRWFLRAKNVEKQARLVLQSDLVRCGQLAQKMYSAESNEYRHSCDDMSAQQRRMPVDSVSSPIAVASTHLLACVSRRSDSVSRYS